MVDDVDIDWVMVADGGGFKIWYTFTYHLKLKSREISLIHHIPLEVLNLLAFYSNPESEIIYRNNPEHRTMELLSWTYT